MARFLKGNQGTECPSNVFFVDCEARRADHDGLGKTFSETFRLGVVTHCKLVKGSITHQETFTFYEALRRGIDCDNLHDKVFRFSKVLGQIGFVLVRCIL